MAGCLQAAGLHLGSVNTFAHFNQRGNREHEPIRDLHEKMLSAQGFSWQSPPNHQLAFDAESEPHLRTHVATLEAHKQWGVKDPRAIFFTHAWQDMFDCEIAGTFRHPIEVARSLEARATKWKQPLERETALTLWKTYNDELLRLHAKSPFMLIRYGMGVKCYTDQIRGLSRHLELNADQAASFYTQELTHQNSADMPVPESCTETWEKLVEIWRRSCEDLGTNLVN